MNAYPESRLIELLLGAAAQDLHWAGRLLELRRNLEPMSANAIESLSERSLPATHLTPGEKIVVVEKSEVDVEFHGFSAEQLV